MMEPAGPQRDDALQLWRESTDVHLRGFWAAEALRLALPASRDELEAHIGQDALCLSPVSAFLLRPLDALDAGGEGDCASFEALFEAAALAAWQARLPPHVLARATAQAPDWDAAALQLSGQQQQAQAQVDTAPAAALRLRAVAARAPARPSCTQAEAEAELPHASRLLGAPVLARLMAAAGGAHGRSEGHGACLLLAGLLERMLGDLLALHAPVPPLLRDVLAHGRTAELLGPALLRALDAAVGSPSGLNLRNVLWHGFAGAQTSESLRAGPLLLQLVRAVQRRMPAGLPARPLTELGAGAWLGPAPPLALLQAATPSPDAVRQLLRSGALPHGDGRAELLQEALCSGSPVPWPVRAALLVSVLEMQLRLLFVAVHRLPSQMLRAEGRAYYSTLELLLAREAPLDASAPNRLQALLVGGTLELLHDLLVHPAGPRLRDRLAHGELRLDVPEPPHVLTALQCAVVALTARWCPRPPPAAAELVPAVAAHQSRFHPRRQARLALFRAAHELTRVQRALDAAHQTPSDALAECRDGPQEDASAMQQHVQELRAAVQLIDSAALWTPLPDASTSGLSEAMLWTCDVGGTLHGSPNELSASASVRRALLAALDVASRLAERLEQLCERVAAGTAGQRQHAALRRLLGCARLLQLLPHALVLRCELHLRLLERGDARAVASAGPLAGRLVPLCDKALTALVVHQWDRALQLLEPVCRATAPPVPKST